MTNPIDPNSPLPPEEGQDTWPEILGGFPRHLTTQLIEEGEGSRTKREVGAAWLLGLGLALLALTLPQERLIGEAFVGVHEQSALWTLWNRVHVELAGLFGLRGEQLRFLTAALAYGACLPAALGLGRRLGCPFGLSLIASVVALLSPSAWLAATTPGMASTCLFVSLLLARELWRARGPRTTRCLLLWGLLIGLQDSLSLLWPALVWACRHSEEDPARRRKLTLTWILVGLGIVVVRTALLRAGWDPVAFPAHLDLDASRWHLDSSAGWRVLFALPALGLAAAGLASLWLLKRNESELPPPRWLLMWTILPVVGWFRNSTLTWDASYQWLLPVALIGLFDLLARWDARQAPTLGVAGLALQLALLWGAATFAVRSDPLEEWRDAARQFLQPGDTVITGDDRHAYLTAHRWGLKSVVLRATDRRHPSSEFVDGVYVNELGLSNLRVKTQDVAAWAEEAREAHGLGFRVILDRPFAAHSEGVAAELERELEARVEFQTLTLTPTAADQ